MAILNVVKWEVTEKEIVHKYPSDNLKLGSQLVVYPGQTAFFAKGGKICDEFICGTYTIKSENIPILGSLINLPYGGSSPFKADVWFVNNISLLDCKWGTITPLQVEDPQYQIIVPARAFGQYGIKIANSRLFLESLVGNMPTFSTDKVIDYFRGVILSRLTSIIYEKLKESSSSILNINSELIKLSEYAKSKLSLEFEKYGISIELFKIMSISVDENDPSFIRLKEAKDAAAKIKIIGKDDYRMTRSYDVLDAVAQNENGGGLLGGAVGLGAGISVGKNLGTMLSQATSSPSLEDIPPSIPAIKYYFAIRGKQQGPFSFEEIEKLIQRNEIDGNTLIWRKGMKKWDAMNNCKDFTDVYLDDCPPPITE